MMVKKGNSAIMHHVAMFYEAADSASGLVFCPASGQVVQAAGEGKTLIVYFIRGDNVQSKQQLDVTSSDSINISGKRCVGNAELVAKKIKKQMGGTLYSIKVKNKYTNSYDELVDDCRISEDFVKVQKSYILFLSPHSHMLSKMGIKDFPRSVRLYSTFGGICGYSFRWTNWSVSRSFRVELKVLKEIPPIYFFISLNRTTPNSIRV